MDYPVGLRSAFTSSNFETQKFTTIKTLTDRFQIGVVMTEMTVRRLEMCIRTAGFLAKNPMVFGKGSQGPALVAQFKRVVDDIRSLIVKYSSGIAAAHGNSGKRGTA